jgi:hypothetical protein
MRSDKRRAAGEQRREAVDVAFEKRECVRVEQRRSTPYAKHAFEQRPAIVAAPEPQLR